jgi:hypothetical protein
VRVTRVTNVDGSGDEDQERDTELRTTFRGGTHPIGQDKYGVRGIAIGLYRVDAAEPRASDPTRSAVVSWALHNSPNRLFDLVVSGANHTPFFVPVASANFLTTDNDGIWTLVEAY